MTDLKKSKKILIMGLDNAGKSSIILSLQSNSNLMTMLKLKPTKGVKIVDVEDEEVNYFIWDYGGQEAYRMAHLESLKKGLHKAEKIIYVVDVQETSRFDASLEYLENILKICDEIQVSLHLSIFLHKCDPDYEEINEKQLSGLVKRMIEKIPENIEFEVFKTSIFTVFRKLIYDYKTN